DREWQAKGPRGPLHGIPVLVKDNLDTADRMATTAGSLALVGARPPDDAFVVRRLRQAGAGLLGQTKPNARAHIRRTNSPAAGAAAAARPRTPTPWIATRAAPAPGRPWPSPPTCAPWPSAPRPTARSSAPRQPTASSASSRPSAWSAGRA